MKAYCREVVVNPDGSITLLNYFGGDIGMFIKTYEDVSHYTKSRIERVSWKRVAKGELHWHESYGGWRFCLSIRDRVYGIF